jgi:hypothetical protein
MQNVALSSRASQEGFYGPLVITPLKPLHGYTVYVYTEARREKLQKVEKALDRVFDGGLKNGENPGA